MFDMIKAYLSAFRHSRKGQAGGVIQQALGVILLLAVLMTIVIDQKDALNATAIGSAGMSIVNILPLGVAILALVLIFQPMLGGRR